MMYFYGDRYPTGLVACVSDSYDLWDACTNKWGAELKDKVCARVCGNMCEWRACGWVCRSCVHALHASISGRVFA